MDEDVKTFVEKVKDSIGALTSIRDWILFGGVVAAWLIWQWPWLYEKAVRITGTPAYYYLEDLSVPPEFNGLKRQVYFNDSVRKGGSNNFEFFVNIPKTKPIIYASGDQVIPARKFDRRANEPADAFSKTSAGQEFRPGMCLFTEDVVMRPFTVNFVSFDEDGSPKFDNESHTYSSSSEFVKKRLGQIRSISGKPNDRAKAALDLLKTGFPAAVGEHLECCHGYHSSDKACDLEKSFDYMGRDIRTACRVQVRVKAIAASCRPFE